MAYLNFRVCSSIFNPSKMYLQALQTPGCHLLAVTFFLIRNLISLFHPGHGNPPSSWVGVAHRAGLHIQLRGRQELVAQGSLISSFRAGMDFARPASQGSSYQSVSNTDPETTQSWVPILALP